MPTRKIFGKKNTYNAPATTIGAPAKLLGRVAQPVAPSPTSLGRKRWPFLSVALTAFLAVIFWIEQSHRVDPLPGQVMSFRDIVALGGVSRYLVFNDNEWWRVFTAPWLHGSTGHLVGNSVTLVLAAAYLERMLGRGWLALLFFAGTIAGSFGSMAYSSATMVSVGASGAIMCLVTALFALSHHYEAGKGAARMRRRALLIVIPAFLPSAAESAAKIDYGAHFGGAAAGIAIGFLLLIFWPEEESSPPWRLIASGVAAIGVSVTLYAATKVVSHFDDYAARSATLIPSATANADPEGLARQSEDLVDRYPHDPLARLLRGTDFFDQQDFGDAEAQARTGLSERDILATQFAPVLEKQLDLLLMASLWGEGLKDEARALSGKVCAVSSTDAYLVSGRQLLVRVGACS